MTKLFALIALLTFGSISCAMELNETRASVSFWNDIRPVLQVHCQGCHQPAKKGGDYLLTSFAAMMNSGESEEKPIVAGDVENSYLFQQLNADNGVAEMPKGKPPLDTATVELFRRWILEGAIDDSPAPNANGSERVPPQSYSFVPPITAMEVSADRKLIAVSGYHEVIVHDLHRFLKNSGGSDSIVGRLAGLSERIESIAFSPKRDFLAVSGGSPGRIGEIQIWKLDSNKLLYSLAAWHDCCFGVSWSPDGKLVAFGGPDNSVQVVDAATGSTVFTNRSHSDWVLGTAFSKSSQQVVSVSRDRTMKLFDISSERFLTNLARFEANLSRVGIQAVARHPHRDEYLIGGTDRVARIYDSISKKDKKIGDDSNLIQKFSAVPGRIFDVEFSPDGQRVIVAGDLNGQGFAHAFDIEKPKAGKPMQKLGGGIFSVVQIDGGATIASAGFDSTIYLNDTKTGELIGKLDPFPRGP